jgi:hypothetical protein
MTSRRANDEGHDRTVEDSFPASDPPASTGITGPRAKDPEGAGGDRIRVIEESLWPQVPADVIEEAKQTAQAEPTWIAMQSNGHVVVTVPPGSPDGATGDVIYIAEVSPVQQS